MLRVVRGAECMQPRSNACDADQDVPPFAARLAARLRLLVPHQPPRLRDAVDDDATLFAHHGPRRGWRAAVYEARASAWRVAPWR
jgi:hypothetical protein